MKKMKEGCAMSNTEKATMLTILELIGIALIVFLLMARPQIIVFFLLAALVALLALMLYDANKEFLSRKNREQI